MRMLREAAAGRGVFDRCLNSIPSFKLNILEVGIEFQRRTLRFYDSLYPPLTAAHPYPFWGRGEGKAAFSSSRKSKALVAHLLNLARFAEAEPHLTVSLIISGDWLHSRT